MRTLRGATRIQIYYTAKLLLFLRNIYNAWTIWLLALRWHRITINEHFLSSPTIVAATHRFLFFTLITATLSYISRIHRDRGSREFGLPLHWRNILFHFLFFITLPAGEFFPLFFEYYKLLITERDLLFHTCFLQLHTIVRWIDKPPLNVVPPASYYYTFPANRVRLKKGKPVERGNSDQSISGMKISTRARLLGDLSITSLDRLIIVRFIRDLCRIYVYPISWLSSSFFPPVFYFFCHIFLAANLSILSRIPDAFLRIGGHRRRCNLPGGHEERYSFYSCMGGERKLVRNAFAALQLHWLTNNSDERGTEYCDMENSRFISSRRCGLIFNVPFTMDCTKYCE